MAFLCVVFILRKTEFSFSGRFIKKIIMKKLFILTALLIFGFTNVTQAQLQERTFMLGSDLGSGLTSTTNSGLFGFNLGLNDGAGYDIGISPKAGYFLTDSFVLGGIVNLGFTKSPENSGVSTKSFTYGVQAFSRYYLTPEEARLGNVVPTGQLYMETNAGLAGVNVSGGSTTNGFTFGFGPGYSLFLNENVALEAAVKYNGLVGAGNTDYQNSLSVNLGIQVFLTRSDARDAVEPF